MSFGWDDTTVKEQKVLLSCKPGRLLSRIYLYKIASLIWAGNHHLTGGKLNIDCLNFL